LILLIPLTYTVCIICSLGAEWKEDPSKIPVDEIAEVWRSESKGGRYEAALWKASGLEEMASHQADAARRSDGDNGDEENEVDNLQAGGVFARYGWDYTTQNRGEHAGINLGTRRMPASASPASASPAPAEGAPAEGAPAEEPDSDSDSDSDLDLQCFREAVVAVL